MGLKPIEQVKVGDEVWCRNHFERVNKLPEMVDCNCYELDQGFSITIPANKKRFSTFPLSICKHYNLNYNKGWFAAGFIDAHNITDKTNVIRIMDMGIENGKFNRSYVALVRDVSFRSLTNLAGKTMWLKQEYRNVEPKLEDISPESLSDYVYGYMIFKIKTAERVLKKRYYRGKLIIDKVPQGFAALMFRLLNLYFVYTDDKKVRLSYTSIGDWLKYLPFDNILNIRALMYQRAVLTKETDNNLPSVRSMIIKTTPCKGWWLKGMYPDINNVCTDELDTDIDLIRTSKDKYKKQGFFDLT